MTDLPKLCIVDDDIALTQVLARRLTANDYSVVVFTEPVTEQQLIHTNAHCFLLDMRFAAQSGLHFVAPLRQALPQARIVMLTGFASIASAVQAIKLGADDFLTKPVDFSTLLQSLAGTNTLTTEQETTLMLSPEQVEWEHIQRVLQQHEGNVSQTARLLGMHRRTLQRKLQKRRP
ncbi:response regulator [Rheinheimera sp. D18]|uniref:response regulator transcription factor n=1 Tax=Rheinheimera sp. D18 TaxID=2545632 RepID=UPI00104C912A|nr:response regulator [Rheinheimera sp. D18]QBL09729.1 response regulator [Rheinheimera sp. D18]